LKRLIFAILAQRPRKSYSPGGGSKTVFENLLDLGRVGIVPDPKYLCTTSAKECVRRLEKI